MSNSISIRLNFVPPDSASFDKGREHGGQGLSPANLRSISLEIGDIDFLSDGGPEGSHHGSNFLEMGDIDFPPGGGSGCPSHKSGHKDSAGTPDDMNGAAKDLSGALMLQQFFAFLARMMGNQKQDGDDAVNKPEGTKRSKANHDHDAHRSTGTGHEDPVQKPDHGAPSKRETHDLDTQAPPSSQGPNVTKDEKVKPPPKTNGDTTVSSSSRAGPVLPPNTGVVEVNKPIVVGPNETFDGKNKLFKAGPGLDGGGTAETQDPVFILAPGAKLKNVQFEGGDGIHLLGDAKLDNVHAVHGGPDDMVTIDGPGNKAHDAQLAGISPSTIPNRPANVEITNSSFRHSHDKAIQVNGDANIKLKGVYAEDVGQLLVTLGGQPITANVSIEDSSIKGLRSHLFRLDSHNSTLDIGADVTTDNGQLQVMMGDPAKARGATRVMASTDRA